jgi:hypothetical protein
MVILSSVHCNSTFARLAAAFRAWKLPPLTGIAQCCEINGFRLMWSANTFFWVEYQQLGRYYSPLAFVEWWGRFFFNIKNFIFPPKTIFV